MKKAFINTSHNSIHLTFPNGNSISTIWGYLTYSDNHNFISGNIVDKFSQFMESDTVEIMILEAPDKLRKKISKKYGFSVNDVKGYLSITEWLDILKMLAK